MNCFIYFWNLRARVRAGVSGSRGEGVTLGSMCFQFVLHFAIVRVDVNLIQKLCYMEGGIPWRESSFLWTAYAQNLFAVCLLVRAEMKEWGSCDWLSELWESGGLVPQFTPTLHGREHFARPLFKPTIVQRCRRWPPSVPAFGSKVLGWVEDTGNRIADFQGHLAYENLHSAILLSLSLVSQNNLELATLDNS